MKFWVVYKELILLGFGVWFLVFLCGVQLKIKPSCHWKTCCSLHVPMPGFIVVCPIASKTARRDGCLCCLGSVFAVITNNCFGWLGHWFGLWPKQGLVTAAKTHLWTFTKNPLRADHANWPCTWAHHFSFHTNEKLIIFFFAGLADESGILPAM